METLGVLGFGGMGRVIAGFAEKAGLDIVVYDIAPKALEKAGQLGYRVVKTLEEIVALSDYVMVSVPGSITLEVLKRLARLPKNLLAGRLVFDTSTFKEGILEGYAGFGEEVLTASSHPLFGPGATKPDKHVFVVIPVPNRERGADSLEKLAWRMGFRVVRMDWKEHDRLMGFTIGLPYALASALSGLLQDKPFLEETAGTSFRLLLLLVKSIASSPPDLTEDILSNIHSKRALEEFITYLIPALGEPEKAAAFLENASEAWGRESLGEAYSKFYRCLEDV